MANDGDSTDFNEARADIFEAISHPARIKILQTLNEKPMGFAELGRAVGIEGGGHLSFHLRKLVHLVKMTPEGTYTLTGDGKEALWSINALRKSTNGTAPNDRESSITHRKWTKPVLAVLVIALIALGGISVYEEQTIANQAGMISDLKSQVSQMSDLISHRDPRGWSPYFPYPINITGQSCVTSSDYIYCVGGFTAKGFSVRTINGSTNADYKNGDYTSSVYYLPLNTNGQWASTTNYPTGIWGQSCVTYSSFIYCVGGLSSSAGALTFTNSVYFAPLTATGVSSWTSTSKYPTAVNFPSCVASTGYIYCVGGYNEKEAPVNATYYAPMSSSGVGPWRSTESPPDTVLTTSCANPLPSLGGPEASCPVVSTSCAASSGYIYCVGGEKEVEKPYPTSASYYAPISSSGIGSWSRTTDYPFPIGAQPCAISNGYVYCVGGGYDPTIATYYAQVSSSGIGSWFSTTEYPIPTGDQSCIISSGYIYCIGGSSEPIPPYGVYLPTDAVFFAQLSGLNPR